MDDLVRVSTIFRRRFNPSVVSYRAILYELGLQGKLTTDQLAKKWDNLKRRYKVIAHTHTRGIIITSSDFI